MKMKVQKYIDILKYWKEQFNNKFFSDDMDQVEDKLFRLQNCVNALEGLVRHMQYVDQVYQILVEECGNLDSIYEDYIINLIGIKGLNSLKEKNLLETCGVVNGRQLYALCDKK